MHVSGTEHTSDRQSRQLHRQHSSSPDEVALAAILAAAEHLAQDRDWDYTDLTYIQAMSELAATPKR